MASHAGGNPQKTYGLGQICIFVKAYFEYIKKMCLAKLLTLK